MGECESCHDADAKATEYTLKKTDMTRKVKLCDACAERYTAAGHTLSGGKSEAKPTTEADEEGAPAAEEAAPRRRQSKG